MTTPQTSSPSQNTVQPGTALVFTAETAGSRYELMVGRDDGSWLVAVANMGVSARVGHLNDPNYLSEKLRISRVDAAQIIECVHRHLSGTDLFQETDS
jgi:hypothetical protein